MSLFLILKLNPLINYMFTRFKVRNVFTTNSIHNGLVDGLSKYVSETKYNGVDNGLPFDKVIVGEFSTCSLRNNYQVVRNAMVNYQLDVCVLLLKQRGLELQIPLFVYRSWNISSVEWNVINFEGISGGLLVMWNDETFELTSVEFNS